MAETRSLDEGGAIDEGILWTEFERLPPEDRDG